MKITIMKKQLGLAIFTGSLALVATSVSAVMTMEYNKIVLKVEGEAPNEQLVVDKNDTRVKGCNSNKPGCVEVGQGNMAEFEVRIKQGYNNCSGNSGRWAIQKVLLGGEVQSQNPGTKPTSFGGLSETASKDFNANKTTGEVKLNKPDNKRVKFYDTNNKPYSIWYTVVAELCGDGRTIMLDPSVTNRGK